MKHLLRVVAIVALVLSSLPLTVLAAPSDPATDTQTGVMQPDLKALAKIEPQILKELEKGGMTTYLVYMNAKASLTPEQAGLDTLARRTALVDALQTTAAASQAPLAQYLNAQQAAGQVESYTSYWIFNGLAVTGDQQTLYTLAARPDVERVQANHVRHLVDSAVVVAPGAAEEMDVALATSSLEPTAVEWNIAKVRAPDVWHQLGITGQGVVVANLDTGVYYPHPALQRKYRGYNNGNPDHNYNWFDATGTYANAPNDGHGHGTHTMGTMVGSEANGANEIGVAPGAQWIAVKVFDDGGSTTDAELHASFQWIMAPTNLQGQNADPAKAPDIVSNSWGDTNSSDQTFWQDVLNLRAAGILPVFAGGNNGPGAGSVDSPGSYPQSFAVGATSINDTIASFSGRGPSPWGEIKPDMSAPGVSIRSSVPPVIDQSMYEGGWSGTSMATPHVAAAAALLLQASSGLTITATEFALTNTALALPTSTSAPNNDYGWGRLDVYQAVSAVLNGGRFWGRVTDVTSSQPLPGALVAMERQDAVGSAQTMADAQGYYTFTVGAGIYQVMAKDFWHITSIKAGVEITAGYTTILDFALERQPTGVVRGQVSSEGAPVTATIIISGAPLIPTTDGTGVYSVTLPVGSYDLRVRPANGYRQATAAGVAVVQSQQTTRDFDLAAAPRILLVDADAWSANASRIAYYKADLDTLLYTYDLWTVTSLGAGLPATSTLRTYDILVWHQPTTSPGYINTWAALSAYLDQGGRLFISGQDIGRWDDDGAARTYYRNYLHAQYARDDSGIRSATGISGDLFNAISVSLNTEDSAQNQTSPDAIGPLDGAATTVLTYTATITPGSPAGIKIDPGTYHAIYLPFGLEGVGPQAQRQQLLSTALDWLALPALKKSADRAQAAPGQSITYTLRLANSSSTVAGGLSVIDPLPPALSYVIGSATGGLLFDDATGQMRWQGSLAPHTMLTMTFQARLASLPGRTPVTNTAYLRTTARPDLPSVASLVASGPDLSSSRKTVWPPVVASGQEVTFTIALTNTGLGASTVFMADPLPAGTAIVTGSISGGATYNPTQNQVEWTGVLTAPVPGLGEYTFKTSDQAGGPAFSWVDISGTGTLVSLADDDTKGPFDIGFPFTYYGQTYTSFYVSSNGWMTFLPPPNASYNNACLPDPAGPPALLALLWDDLNPSTSGSVYVMTGTNSLVVSYVSVPRFSSGGPYTFQAILQPDGTIIYQYLDMQGSRLNEATVGIMDETRSKALSVACNEYYIHDGLAVRFTPLPMTDSVKTVSFRAKVGDLPAGTAITNTALASAGGITLPLSASLIANTVDLTTSVKTVDKTAAGFGDSLIYTVQARNSGTATGSVMLTDTLPAQVTYIPSSASYGAWYSDATRSIHWMGPVTPGGSVVITFGVTLAPGLPDNTVITNTAVLSAPGAETRQRSAFTLYQSADLSPSRKEAGPTSVRVGDHVTYTITLANGGAGMTSFMVTDSLPAGLTYVPFSLQTGHGDARYDAGARQILWSGNAPGQHQTYLRFMVSADSSGMFTNTALIRDRSGLVIQRSAAFAALPLTVTPTPTPAAGETPRPWRLYLPVIINSSEGM